MPRREIKGRRQRNGVRYVDTWDPQLSLNVLTNHCVERNKPVGQWIWAEQMRALLAQCLDLQTFAMLMKGAFPRVQLEQQDIEEALHFLLKLLKPEPEERPSAEVILKHRFLLRKQHQFESGDSIPEKVKKSEGPTMGQRLFSAADAKFKAGDAKEILAEFQKDCSPAIKVQSEKIVEKEPTMGQRIFREAAVLHPNPPEVKKMGTYVLSQPGQKSPNLATLLTTQTYKSRQPTYNLRQPGCDNT